MSLHDKKDNERYNNTRFLMRYTSLAMQLLLSLGAAVFLGLKADSWISLTFPLFSWLLPLLVLMAILYKVVKDTSPKK
ncbi:MAG TPA: hypothetical protein VFN30_12400 [Chitinophagaceae bacterium]|nr:hypothetical protein [Chitinophagaceae bacterium]